MATTPNRFLERIAKGPVICAEGYVFELERRGYLQAGPFVPEVVLENPHALEQLHEEYARAGSDIVCACTYYAHEQKLSVIGREASMEELNLKALEIAGRVAKKYDALLAGDLSNTNTWIADPPTELVQKIRHSFDLQAKWAAAAGADLIIGETFTWLGEALACLDAIKAVNLPAVITLCVPKEGVMRDGATIEQALQQLEAAGAAVVGVNCNRGPDTILEYVERAVKAVKVPVAALPVPYRTNKDAETFFQFQCNHPDAATSWGLAFPTALEPFLCTRYEMARFAERAVAAGCRYVGGCCGTGPQHVRAMAEALGRKPPASKYTEDLSKHSYIGTNTAKAGYTDYLKKL